MTRVSASSGHRDWSHLVKAAGLVLLATGAFFAFVGPVEMYCFTLFSEGGRFHYAGFGFGSLMFANIAIQVAGYYAIAAVGLGLGIGHLRLKRWARDLATTFCAAWLVAGFPLTLIALLMFIQAKDPSTTAFLAALPVAALVYPVVPLLLLRVYQGETLRRTFEEADPIPSPLAGIPLPVRVLGTLLIINILALHGMILFRGMFPLFGVLLVDLPGIQALAVLFLLLAALTWGVMHLKRWAWWGTLITYATLVASTALTLPHYSVGRIIGMMRFAPVEMDALAHLPFLDATPTLVAVLPLLVMLGLTGWAYRHFRPGALTEADGTTREQPA